MPPALFGTTVRRSASLDDAERWRTGGVHHCHAILTLRSCRNRVNLPGFREGIYLCLVFGGVSESGYGIFVIKRRAVRATSQKRISGAPDTLDSRHLHCSPKPVPVPLLGSWGGTQATSTSRLDSDSQNTCQCPRLSLPAPGSEALVVSASTAARPVPRTCGWCTARLWP